MTTSNLPRDLFCTLSGRWESRNGEFYEMGYIILCWGCYNCYPSFEKNVQDKKLFTSKLDLPPNKGICYYSKERHTEQQGFSRYCSVKHCVPNRDSKTREIAYFCCIQGNCTLLDNRTLSEPSLFNLTLSSMFSSNNLPDPTFLLAIQPNWR